LYALSALPEAIMKLYDGGRFPNPRRVRVFIAEKGIAMPPLQQVDLAALEHKSEAFTALNPLQRIPVLELDDGTIISESVAICRYFEEIYPEPPLFGVGATGKAIVEMWHRRIELGLYASITAAFRHGHPGMAGHEVPQVAEWAEVNRGRVEKHLRLLDNQLSRHSFVTGDTYTIADITAMIAVDFMRLPKLTVPDDCVHLKRWHGDVASRPASKA
jgi:glutathione S-transferase